ncbi:MAG: hypothetical protein JWR15_3958 [Prosthecobacter sp.]|nr:hypothetical protein [Prosthecobacter sp.]
MALGCPSLRTVRALVWGGALWIFVLGLGIQSSANPTGGVVVLGDAQIQNIVPGLTTIHQQTDRAVIDWSSFNIGSGEHTNFIVPDATSATLNRVLNGGPSLLNGSLTSNGQVFLINASGIVFGQGSVVDVAGLTASTLDLGNRAFMAGGDMVFSGSSSAAVTNAGSIRSSGDVFLIGFQVNNSGSIRAPNGTVGLAAGMDVLIRPVGDERVIVRNAAGPRRGIGVSNSGLIEANVAELKAHGGNVYALAIRNSGRIAATAVTKQGGRILLSANGGSIDNRGTLVARGPSGNGGQIKINAGSKGRVTLSGGRVDANGTTGKGGSVSLTGEEVTIRRAIPVTADGETAGGVIDIGDAATVTTVIEGVISADASQGAGGVIRLGGASLTLGGEALISASGATGGGSIFAGGGAQGLDASMSNSTQVQIQPGAILQANAVERGDGGTVVVFASKDLTFNGSLQARGGAFGGNGGQAELSGKEALIVESLTGRIDLSSPHGSAGTLLLDPNDIYIGETVAGSPVSNPAQANFLKASDISQWLNSNSGSLIIQTNRSATGGSGDITLAGDLKWTSATSLIFNADRDFIMVSNDIFGGGNVTINAGRSVLLDGGAIIATSSGNITINANQGASVFEGDYHGIVIRGPSQLSTVSGSIFLTGRAGNSSGSAGTLAIWLDGGSLTNFEMGHGGITLKTTGGDVVGTGILRTEFLKLAGSGDFHLTGARSTIQNLASVGSIGSLQLISTSSLTIGSIGADSGLSAFRDIDIDITNIPGERLQVNQALSSQGGNIVLHGSDAIVVNGTRVSTTGSGGIFISAGRTVTVNSGAIISVVDGRMELNGNQEPEHTGGNFTGIVLDNAALITSGKGDIELNARSGNSGTGNIGILMRHGATIRSTSTAADAGTVMIRGVADGADNGNRGVSLQDAGTAVTSAGADVTILGAVPISGVQNTGVELGAGTAVSGGGATIITTDTISISGAAAIGGGGTLAIRSISAGTTIGLGDGAAGTLSINSAGIGAISGLSHVTIGAANAGNVEIRAATWRAPLTILTLGEILVSDQVTNLVGSVTFEAASTVLAGSILTAGQEIIIHSPIRLSANSALDSTNKGSVLNGANITISGAINSALADNSSGPDLVINAGLAGDVTLQGVVGSSAALHAVSVTGARLIGVPGISTRTFLLTAGGAMNLSNLSASTASITGRSGDDTIILAQAPATLSINGAGGNDTVTFASATGPVSVNAGSFTSIENVIGSASHADTLVGAAGGNVFLVTGNNAGTLGTLKFTSFESLTGSSTGANQFTFSNQATLDGRVNGAGNPLAVVIINDSNLQAGQTYTIGAALVTVGSRSYAFQGVNTLGLNLGAGNDSTATSFYTFTQNLSGGGGDDQLLVDGTKVVTSPLTKPGFGTITTIGFQTAPPTDKPVVSSIYLQNFVSGSSSSTASSAQTNNFNSTSTSGVGGLGGIGAQGVAGALAGSAGLAAATSVSSFLGNAFSGGAGSMGGGGPASLDLQSQMNSSMSAAAERELNMSIGGDGTIRLQNGGGSFGIDPSAGAPGATSSVQLDLGISLLAQSELAIGAIGNGEVPVTVQAGAQPMTMGDPLPSLSMQQFLLVAANPEAFSSLFRALGGDGTARLEFISGSSTIELNGKLVPRKIELALLSSMSPGALGELALALGGIGEVIVTDSMGMVTMDPSGTAGPPEVQIYLHALLAAATAVDLSLALGENGSGLVVAWDGIENTAFDGELPGPFVILKLDTAINTQSQEELDHAIR